MSRYELLNARVPVKLDLERIRTIKQRFLKLRYVFEFDDFISGWFHGAPVSAIRRGNLEDFVAYGFYTHSMHDLTPQVWRSRCPHSISSRASSLLLFTAYSRANILCACLVVVVQDL